MPTFKQTVSSAGKLLLAHPVGQQQHVTSLWNKVQFHTSNEQETENDAVAHPADDAITLYPALLQKTPAQAQTIVLREFGKILLRKSGDAGSTRWMRKLVLPDSALIATVQTKLQDPGVRSANSTYREFVETFQSAMERLVALNISNALLSNGVPFPGSGGININVWGPTSEYSNLKKYHSIIPFSSAYAPRQVHTDYGSAFAEMIINKMRSVRESSTARALEGLIREIAEAAF